jgi:hypothetical protein
MPSKTKRRLSFAMARSSAGSLQAIRDHLERKGMYYIIDPTDEQYRTL